LPILLHPSSLLLHLPFTHAILEIVLHWLIMVKLSFDLNVRKDSSDTDEVEQKDALHQGRGSSINTIPEAVVKIATTEIDLEAPAALEPETDETYVYIIKAAAEAIISISSFEER
ncbi:hypothetical protein Tco_0945293, partial [Tanacetum coccineum]